MTNLSLVRDAGSPPDRAGESTPAVHAIREFLFGRDAAAGFPGDDGRLERLASVDVPRMAAALAFLAGCAPETFDYVLDGVEPFPGGEPDPWDEPEPYCTLCGGQVGIFLRLGLDWRHFRGDGTVTSKIELLDAGHVPVVAWRLPAEACR
jgi:hypothetical protein